MSRYIVKIPTSRLALVIILFVFLFLFRKFEAVYVARASMLSESWLVFRATLFVGRLHLIRNHIYSLLYNVCFISFNMCFSLKVVHWSQVSCFLFQVCCFELECTPR